MAIKAPSLQSDYSLIFSGDDALKLPEDEAEREHALTVARDTGRWDDLLVPGAKPTIFDVRPLTGSDFAHILGESHRLGWIALEECAYALRLALRKVTNLGEFKVEPVDEGGRSMASTNIINAIYATGGGRAIVLELGHAVIRKAQNSPSPK